MNILLTIAIPTIQSRKDCFNKLLKEFKKQSEPYGDQIEIISLCDNKEMPIGEKRNRLNSMANGKYVVQWDDDDWISEDGIELIMEGIKMDVDCITYDAPCIKPPLDENRMFKYSIKNFMGFIHLMNIYIHKIYLPFLILILFFFVKSISI